MGTYIIRRLIAMVLMLIALSMLVFGIFTILPADPASLTCGKSCNAQVIAQNRIRLGYDKPKVEHPVMKQGVDCRRHPRNSLPNSRFSQT